jgi:Collagen triple helix repeat (20 copies)
MFSVIRRHMNPATVIAMVALVFAITGGAFAATGSGGSSHGALIATAAKAKGKPKAKVGPRGPAGPAGKNGATGSAGPAGTVGAQGAQGAKGEAGPQGAPGQEGPAGKEGKTGLTGKEGKAGIEGKEGSPGPTCNVSGECNLPSGASETGAWSIAGSGLKKSAMEEPLVAITYPLHLTFVPTAKFVAYPESFTAGSVAGCPGTLSEPKAEAGNLCVYAIGGGLELLAAVQALPEMEGKSGAILDFGYEKETTEASMYGTWAVKAP